MASKPFVSEFPTGLDLEEEDLGERDPLLKDHVKPVTVTDSSKKPTLKPSMPESKPGANDEADTSKSTVVKTGRPPNPYPPASGTAQDQIHQPQEDLEEQLLNIQDQQQNDQGGAQQQPIHENDQGGAQQQPIHENAGGNQCMRKCKFMICIVTVLGLIVLVTVVGIILLSISSDALTGTVDNKLGYSGDMIQVQGARTHWSLQVMISQQIQEYDDYHNIEIFLIPERDVIVHQCTDNFTSRLLKQDNSSLTTGAVGYKYLVKGSNISYELCAASYSELPFEQKGIFHIFDNYDDYFTYKFDTGSSQNAVYFQIFTIFSDNQTTCTKFNYIVKKTSYYFLTASTPGKIFYNYSYDILKRYYNRNDYDASCNIIVNEECKITLDPHMYILAFIQRNDDTLTTHIRYEISPSAVALGTGIPFIILAAIGLTIILITCVYIYKRRRH